ncbi:alpha/beta fold hydrolase [Oceaniovalibus sp. ACAM 378]|uniref:alpha/beta fold hydrolase n=1 Tax=Oceaniovalibus sp. ACAM 378 TaxID=2599923 RepID=UPI0011D9BF0C|nr:alpha/beta hydrolase [Oceaniovalibus sp. ACAM 378]TYB86063.1 alpha/beta hydrolase [Oceaniovalibus sp. ACAM 378]
MPEQVISRDGTPIAFERSGSGHAIILIGGILSDRGGMAALSEALTDHFTTMAIDRRGRGDSGDGKSYAVKKEIEDIAALIEALGNRPTLFGHSSGAALALHAAATGLPINSLILYEPPFSSEDAPEAEDTYVAEVEGHLHAGRHAEAIKAFLAASGVPDEMAAAMAADPARLRSAPSMANDLDLMGVSTGGRLPADIARRVPVPTLLLTGDQSPVFFQETAHRLGQLIPDARVAVLTGADHSAAPQIVAPAVATFLIEMHQDRVTIARKTEEHLSGEG